MLRLFIAINILILHLYACKDGFEACRLKTVESQSIVNETLQIPVQNNQRLIFSQKTPNAKIIKHDPYLSLYLIEDTKKFKYPFRVNMNISLGTIGVDGKSVIEGKIVKEQVGLNSFAKFSEPLSTPSLLLNSCCALEGIVTPQGIIEKEYIDRFLKVKKVSYSDIGIRVQDAKKMVVVTGSNPFMKDNPFKVDDTVLELNSKKVKNSAEFMRDILFSKIGSVHKIKIKRDSKILTFNVMTQNRVGGGFLSDTFLEFFGISFDKNLCIIKIEKKAEQYGLKLGDKLLQVNMSDIQNAQDISRLLDNCTKSVNLLFQREQFQFFVKVN